MDTDKELGGMKDRSEIEIQNELLKAKLTAEFGMARFGGNLDPFLENEFLKDVYEIEKALTSQESISVYEYIGRPVYRPHCDLKAEEVTPELERLLEIMINKNVELASNCEYDDSVMYKFVTEEFFFTEIDNIRFDGLVTTFTYEDFHPNHEYDLRIQTEEVIKSIYKEKICREPFEFMLDNIVEFRKKEINASDFTANVLMFRESSCPFEFLDLEINGISFSLDTNTAVVRGKVTCDVCGVKTSGDFEIGFKYMFNWWTVCKADIPGF